MPKESRHVIEHTPCVAGSGQLRSVELITYVMARNIPAAEWPTGSPRPLMQCATCGQLIVLDLADRASLRWVRDLRLCALASVRLVCVSNFVSETAYRGRCNGITQVIQIAYKRTVHTYIHTYINACMHTYIHPYIHANNISLSSILRAHCHMILSKSYK